MFIPLRKDKERSAKLAWRTKTLLFWLRTKEKWQSFVATYAITGLI
jgi:hypothetical protein